VALFLLAFGPFGLSATFPNRTLVIAGYGLVTALCMAFLITVPPFLLPKAFAEERWTVGKEIMMMMLTISLIGVGNTVYTWRVFNYDLSLELFLVFQGVTLLVGSIPASFIVILQYQRYQLLFIRGAREIESRVHAPTTSNTHTTIVSKTMKEGASSNLALTSFKSFPAASRQLRQRRFASFCHRRSNGIASDRNPHSAYYRRFWSFGVGGGQCCADEGYAHAPTIGALLYSVHGGGWGFRLAPCHHSSQPFPCHDRTI